MTGDWLWLALKGCAGRVARALRSQPATAQLSADVNGDGVMWSPRRIDRRSEDRRREHALLMRVHANRRAARLRGESL